jgi:PAS domain-containing protein
LVFQQIILCVSASTWAHRGTAIFPSCTRTTAQKHNKIGRPVCARARAVKGVFDFATLKEVIADSSVAPNRSGRVMASVGLGVNLDIEELKCAEQALRESEAKLRDYAETASDWFWETGSDYKITLLTENAFGSEPADRIGTTCWDHALDLETEPEKWRLVRETLDSRQPFRDFVYRGMSGNGSPMS